MLWRVLLVFKLKAFKEANGYSTHIKPVLQMTPTRSSGTLLKISAWEVTAIVMLIAQVT